MFKDEPSNPGIADFYADQPLHWYTPFEWVNYAEAALYTKATGFGKRYLISMYYATQILGGGELGPVNKEEMMYLILTLTVSAILNALIFGDIAGLV